MLDEFPSRYDHKKNEEKIYKLWEKSEYFAPENLPISKIRNSELEIRNFSIHLPPPNITGSLHMGHALNATITDVLIRYHRMLGEKTVWFPGIDHAGIATQNVIEKELKKQGKTRWDIGRDEFVKQVWQWKEKYGDIILNQLKKLGASCDWNRTRFTMDENYAEEVKKVFIHYYEKGLIYMGKRVVNWCPRCSTSLSDLEIEHKEEVVKLWYIKYPLEGEGNIIVATTRPETILGDSAVAVNPNDERYKDLLGKTVNLPIKNRKIPIIADDAIDKSFGTGAVKITPAHDILDSEIGERHGLQFYEVINERGKMTDEAGEEFAGMKTKEARDKVLEELEKLGLIEKSEDYSHNLSTCYRCGTTLEPLLSNQWFLKMGDLAKKAENAVSTRKTKIIPENFQKIYISWIQNVKDWCISRQLWWGHRLPVWIHEEICIPKKSNSKGDENFSECKEMIIAIEKPSCEYCDSEYRQSEDVLDTWFSSALWPFAGLAKDDLKNFYPSNILITARDIINLWVGRMIFSGVEFQGKEPFPEVLIHPTILTKDGKRMSKSLGTGLDPLQAIEENGADAVRFGIIWQYMGTQDIHWDQTSVTAGKKFTTKLWNISRFISIKTNGLKVTNEKPNPQNTIDQEFIKKLSAVKELTEKNLNTYQFGQAIHEIYYFVWHEFADKYIEQAKNRDDEDVNKTLHYTLIECLKILHPFMPFITEEIFQKLYPEKILMIENW